MPLNYTDADQELFRNYKKYTTGYDRVSNSPISCSQITHRTANNLRNKWNPKSNPNQWKQNQANGIRLKDGTVRWVSRSLSQGGNVVDFHALWREGTKTVIFLWHFKIVQ